MMLRSADVYEEEPLEYDRVEEDRERERDRTGVR